MAAVGAFRKNVGLIGEVVRIFPAEFSGKRLYVFTSLRLRLCVFASLTFRKGVRPS